MDVKPRRLDSPRDIAAVKAEGWPFREFPVKAAARTHGVPVIIKQSILNEIHRHGQERPDVEVCGVLVGEGYRDAQGPFVFVEGCIRGEHAVSHAAQVTFTGETWSHVFDQLDNALPHLRIMGWYHTHPGFGIFLSKMDLYIHENFFSTPEQLAFVYDPQSGEEGIFLWRGSATVREGFLVEADTREEPPRRPAASHGAGPRLAASAGSGIDRGELVEQIDRLRRRQDRLVVAVAVLAIVTLLWPLGLAVVGGRALRPGRDGRTPWFASADSSTRRADRFPGSEKVVGPPSPREILERHFPPSPADNRRTATGDVPD
jgi:proteasome lid subunit RPN8/RPN11